MAAVLTPSRIAIVKATAPVLKEHGTTITTLFYQNMINANPELKNIFSMTSQATGAQPRALAASVLAYATYIDDLPKIQHAVERIAHKHVSLQVTPAQYDIVGKYLMEAIGLVLGDAATPEIVDAWTVAYSVLAGVFIGLEKNMYKANAAQNWPGWRKFRIARTVAETESITSFYLAPTDGAALPSFLPGQYISLQLFVPELGHLQSRQYSLSEAPTRNGEYYRISVKREEGAEAGLPGLISNLLHGNYKAGDEVEISHPQGEFFVDPKDSSQEGAPLVLISGGVGATPLMSILGSVAPTDAAQPAVQRPVSWIHAARSSSAQPFALEVKKICAANENVKANVFLNRVGPQDKQGDDYQFGETRLDLSRLDKSADLYVADERSQYYICGPEQFMVDVRQTLRDMGVDNKRIHLELFATGDIVDE